MFRVVFLSLSFLVLLILSGCGGGGGGGAVASILSDAGGNSDLPVQQLTSMDVISTVPAQSIQEAPGGTREISVQFNSPLNSESLNSQMVELLVEGDKVEVDIEANRQVLIIKPKGDFPPGSNIRLVLKSGLRSESGFIMQEPMELNFQMEDDPLPDLFETIPTDSWTETAVRKVLHTFTLGSYASDHDVSRWADLSPVEAIMEILTFLPTNIKLSPPGSLAMVPRDGSLENYRDDIYSGQYPLSDSIRSKFAHNKYYSLQNTWAFAMTQKGPNPFLHRVAFFETNYHLSVNEKVGIKSNLIFDFYDSISKNLSKNTAYDILLGEAAISPAIAKQYNHIKNRFEDGKFSGNEDFGREFHQLFFGILGQGESGFQQFPSFGQFADNYQDYHELITIRNTAKALTGMEISDSGEGLYLSEGHHVNDLEILGKQISGLNLREKVMDLSQIAIETQESRANLPLILVQGLADDELDITETRSIREAWDKMKKKSILDFLRSYAISTTFHSPTRIKSWTSFERNLIYFHRTRLNDLEIATEAIGINQYFRNEGVESFRPIHNVFGHQTGQEAIASPQVFQQAHRATVQSQWSRVKTNGNFGEVPWKKDWSKLLPRDSNGFYQVKDSAEWLWERLIADGLKNFQILERAQVYSLLASGLAFEQLAKPDNPQDPLTSDQIQDSFTLNGAYKDLENSILPDFEAVGKNSDYKVKIQNQRVNLAAMFISMTPYFFIQEGS